MKIWYLVSYGCRTEARRCVSGVLAVSDRKLGSKALSKRHVPEDKRHKRKTETDKVCVKSTTLAVGLWKVNRKDRERTTKVVGLVN